MTSGGIGCDFIFDGIGRIAPRPNARFMAFDGDLAADQKAMFDVEAGTAERAHPRDHLDDIAEARRRDEARAGVHQRNAENAEGGRQFVRLHAERRLEQAPGAAIEKLEEAGVEDDPGGVAMSPLDREMPPVDETGHGGMIAAKACARQPTQWVGARSNTTAAMNSPES